jgi:hypothetical protein
MSTELILGVTTAAAIAYWCRFELAYGALRLYSTIEARFPPPPPTNQRLPAAPTLTVHHDGIVVTLPHAHPTCGSAMCCFLGNQAPATMSDVGMIVCVIADKEEGEGGEGGEGGEEEDDRTHVIGLSENGISYAVAGMYLDRRFVTHYLRAHYDVDLGPDAHYVLHVYNKAMDQHTVVRSDEQVVQLTQDAYRIEKTA